MRGSVATSDIARTNRPAHTFQSLFGQIATPHRKGNYCSEGPDPQSTTSNTVSTARTSATKDNQQKEDRRVEEKPAARSPETWSEQDA
jgi:hypothetical protein